LENPEVLKIQIQRIRIAANVNCSFFTIQSDQKENKSEQALQIIGHVVAEFYTNKHGRSQFVVSNATL
jgi:hypothetical protein